MRMRISRVSVHKTSLIVAILYGVFFVLMLPIFAIANHFSPPDQRIPVWILVVMIPVYLLLCYVLTAIAVGLFNVLSRIMGGIEVEWEATSGEARGPGASPGAS